MLQTTEETELKMPSDFRWHSFLVSAGYLPDTPSVTVTDTHRVKTIDFTKAFDGYGCIFEP